jgi:hypothetical protein
MEGAGPERQGGGNFFRQVGPDLLVKASRPVNRQSRWFVEKKEVRAFGMGRRMPIARAIYEIP